ncbi:MAG: hypothetical protein R3F39_01695 [Myxococcota bacterium]
MSMHHSLRALAVGFLLLAPPALAVRPVAIPPRGPAPPLPAPTPVDPEAPLPASAAAIHSNPDSYVVPEQWRESARALVEPGDSGLPGGLELEEVELGNRIRATYRGEAGELKVDVVAPAVAGGGAAWSGERLALVVVSSTLSDDARKAALARVVELLKGRELAWSWFRRAPGHAARDTAREAATLAMREARRLAWLGQADAAKAAVEGVLRDATDPLPLLLEGARILHRAGALEASTALGEQAAALATQAVTTGASTLDAHGRDRLRVAIAMGTALAGEASKAEEMTRDLLRRPSVACEAARVAEELDRVGALAEAAMVAAAAVALDPTCDHAWAIGVDVARHRGDAADAVRIGEQAIAERPVVVLARAALARALVDAGRAEEALLPARVAVGRSGSAAPVLTTLASIAARGVATAEVLEDWSGQAARYPNDAGRVAFGALACWLSNDAQCAADRFAKVRELNGGDAAGTHALQAMMLVAAGRLEDAAAAEKAGWADAEVDLANVAAAAEVAEARGDTPAAVAAWRAYLAGSARELGPVPEGIARSKLRVLTGEGAPATVAGADSSTVPASAPVRAPLWPWLIGASLVVVGAWWWTSRSSTAS